MRKFKIDEIEKVFLSRPAPETFKDAMNSLLVDYNGFMNIDKTGYMMTYFKGEEEDFDPYTNCESPKRFRSPSRDVTSLKSEYKRLASEGLEPKYIIIKTVHRKGADSVTTFINSGTFRDFCNVNYRMPSVNESIRVISTKAFGKVSGMMNKSKLEDMFKDKVNEKNKTPLIAAFNDNYACILPSGKLQMSPMQILKATKESIQNPHEIVQQSGYGYPDYIRNE
jgi:hypothetical protein